MESNKQQSQKHILMPQYSVEVEDYLDQKIKPMFEKYKKHKNKDSIPIKTFKKELKNLKVDDSGIISEILETLSTADMNNSNSIDYDEFKRMICNPRSNLDKKKVSMLVKMLRNITNSVATESESKKRLRNFSLRNLFLSMSPPIFIILITVVQITVFIYNDQLSKKSQDQSLTNTLINSSLIFDPSKRNQPWRYFSYVLVHIDWSHLVCNLLVQVIIGVPLELNHKYKVIGIYLFGCLSGSLFSYLIDKQKYLVGSSASILALVAAFVAYCLFFICEMKIKLFLFFLFISVCFLIEYLTATLKSQKLQQSYYIHSCGILSGFLTGPFFIVNMKDFSKFRIIRLLGISIYFISIIVAFVLNFVL